MIQQHIADFKKVTAKEVSAVIIQLNNWPRKKIRCKTPVDLIVEHMAAIAA